MDKRQLAQAIKQAGTAVVKIVAVLDRQKGPAGKIAQVAPFAALFTSAGLGIAVAN